MAMEILTARRCGKFEPAMSRREDLLVETDWLADPLHDPAVRVLECTVCLHPADVTGGYRVESGRARWAQGHIPGAGFADLQEDLSSLSEWAADPSRPMGQGVSSMHRVRK